MGYSHPLNGATTWLGTLKERAYNFSYDPMNRLLSATQKEKIAVWAYSPSYHENNLSYDLNGNILSLSRRGAGGSNMDVLTYDYGQGISRSNQLLKVKDDGDDAKGFVDGTNTDDDYLYDDNGNMTKDKNKDIDAITYNHLNLPKVVTKTSGEYIRYVYDASGRKLSQEVYDAADVLQKRTDYVGEYIYEDNALQFVNHEEGRVVMTGTAPEYQYHLKDHLGNVRMTFTSKQETESPKATLETANETDERAKFLRYDNIRKVNSALFDKTNGSSAGYAMRLNGSANERIGLARSISVMPGDVVQMEVYAKYVDPNSSNWTAALSTLMGQIASGTAGTVVDGSGYSGNSTTHVPWALVSGGGSGAGPKAYLNYILFDRDYNPILTDVTQTNFVRMSDVAKESGSDVPHEKLSAEVTVKQAGYLYIYLSNEETSPVEVYFDDFKVTQVKSLVVQTDEYYAFGLTFNSYSRENSVANDYKYNGKEEQNELGLGWLDFGFRMYDPAIAKFTGIDPLASKYHWLTPYNYAENSPVANIDLWGLQRYFAADGSLLGQVGDNTDVRVVNSTMTNQQATEYIQSGSAESTQALTGGSVAFADYFQTVADVTNDAALETYSANDDNCFTAANAQLTNEGVTQTGPADAIQTLVDNTAAVNTKSNNNANLTANPFGGAIRVQTELNNGNPVMVGVKETKTDGTVPNPNNTNALTGHFVVVRSVTVAADGTVTFNYLDNAKASTGKSANNNFTLDTSTGAMTDTTTPGGRTSYSSYQVSEVRKNN